ncbi:hypothetical protein AAZX31_13G025200 [Glycine max]
MHTSDTTQFLLLLTVATQRFFFLRSRLMCPSTQYAPTPPSCHHVRGVPFFFFYQRGLSKLYTTKDRGKQTTEKEFQSIPTQGGGCCN